MAEPSAADVFRAIVDNLEEGVYITDRFRKITYWNRGAERITGFLAQDVVGRFCRDNILVHCNEHNQPICTQGCPLQEVIRDGVPREMHVYLRHHDGHRVPAHVRSLPLKDEAGQIAGAAEIFAEHIEAPEFTTQDLVLAASGCLDEETGIPNHALTESYLQECLRFFESHRIQFAVFAIRADRVEEFRAQHGKEAVAAILRAIAHTLRHALPAEDFVGRWGPDRFLVTLRYARQVPLDRAEERLRDRVYSTSVPWWGDYLSMKASTSLTRAQVGDTLETLRDRIEASLAEHTEPTSERADGASV